MMLPQNYSQVTEGLAAIQSEFGPKETMDRLEAELIAQGMRVFARINHAALAAGIDLALRPTELLIFGSPRAGTPLLQSNQTIGIDLPLKVLVWQDESGRTWLSYMKPEWIAKRHGVDVDRAQSVGVMELALATLARKATQRAG